MQSLNIVGQLEPNLLFLIGMTGLELLHPDYLIFIKAAENRSFSRTAEQMAIGQPNVSKIIRKIEKDQGMPRLSRIQLSIVELPCDIGSGKS